MAVSSWRSAILAALMIALALYCATRIAASRLRGRQTEIDADAAHVAMGAAMAGMFAPQLGTLPDGAWVALFSLAAAWFGCQAARSRDRRVASGRLCPHPVPHLVECAAMLYMLLAAPAGRLAGGGATMAGMAGMAGMSGSAQAAAAFPVPAVVLAVFLVGYILGAADQLTARPAARSAARPAARPAASAGTGRSLLVSRTARSAAGSATAPGGQLVLAPRLAAVTKIMMSVAMAYMLVLML